MTTEERDYETEAYVKFRAHAIALRDEGATSVGGNGLSVTFGPKPAPPLTAEAVAAAITANEEPKPVGDDEYIP